jgi:hypothetical protein
MVRFDFLRSLKFRLSADQASLGGFARLSWGACVAGRMTDRRLDEQANRRTCTLLELLAFVTGALLRTDRVIE